MIRTFKDNISERDLFELFLARVKKQVQDPEVREFIVELEESIIQQWGEFKEKKSPLEHLEQKFGEKTGRTFEEIVDKLSQK
jgi:hypothetical protein